MLIESHSSYGLWLWASPLTFPVSSSIKWEWSEQLSHHRFDVRILCKNPCKAFSTMLWDIDIWQMRKLSHRGEVIWSCHAVSYLQNLNGNPALSELRSWSCLLCAMLLPSSPPLSGTPLSSPTPTPPPNPRQSPAACGAALCGMGYSVRACVWCSLVSVLISAVLPGQVSGPPLSHKEGMLGVDRTLQSLERRLRK